MNGIKVIGIDLMCFRVDSITLDSISCSCYDAYAYIDPENVESIGINEWQHRRNKMRVKEMEESFRQ